MYMCLLDETIACGLRIELLAKSRGCADFVVSELASHPFTDNTLQTMRRHLDLAQQTLALSHPDREKYVLSHLCTKFHQAGALDIHLAHVHPSAVSARTILAALNAMDLPQAVTSAHKPPSWDLVLTVESAQALLVPLTPLPTGRHYLQTLQHSFMADMTRRKIFCSAPSVP